MSYFWQNPSGTLRTNPRRSTNPAGYQSLGGPGQSDRQLQERAARSDIRLAKKRGEIAVAQTRLGTVFLTYEAGSYVLRGPTGTTAPSGRFGLLQPQTSILASGGPKDVLPTLASLYVVERHENPSDLTVANTILAQMGGAGRLKAMIGAHSFIGDADSLTFRFKARAANGANGLRVTLAPSDTYTMDFLLVRGISAPVVDEVSNVYAEDLKRIFTARTGLYLSL